MAKLNPLLTVTSPIIGVIASTLKSKEGFKSKDNQDDINNEIQQYLSDPKMSGMLTFICVISTLLTLWLIYIAVMLHKEKNGHWLGYIVAVLFTPFYLMVHYSTTSASI